MDDLYTLINNLNTTQNLYTSINKDNNILIIL